jgi:transglutaminase-like putative cysteine protease
MSARHHVALVGAAATLLASTSMLSIFASWTWLFYSALAVGAVVGSAMVARALRAPVWAQAIAMLAALTVCLSVLFPSGTAFAGLIPTPSTFAYFGQLLGQAGTQMRGESIPVPDLDGLLMLTTLGIGGVAFFVDLCAVGLRRPALTGLPMLAIYSVPVAVLDNSVSIFPFALGAAGYMWLLVTDSVDRVRRFGRRFTGDGRDIDLWEPSPLAAAGRRLGIVGVGVALLVPLAIPAMDWSLFTRFGGAGGDGSGNRSGAAGPSTGSVDLFALLSGSLVREQAHVMVKFTTNDPAPYYLRFAIADQVNNEGFQNRPPTGGRAPEAAFADSAVPTGDGVRSTSYHAAIETVDFNMRFAPIFMQPTAVSGMDADWVFDTLSNQLYARRGTTGKRHFEVDYVRSSYTADALRRAAPVFNPALQALAGVPHVRQIDDLVTELTKGQTTQYDKVLALYKYFGPENHFTYSLAVPPGNSGNAIVDFITGREGFCVQYAAALAWLVRQAGYPARVAFGFTRGAGPDDNGQYQLTNFNLHAWTEVYFEGFGWVPFDATPSAGVLGSVGTRWAPDLTNPDKDENSQIGEDVPTPRQSAKPNTVSPTASQGPIVALPGGRGGSMWPWLIGALVALLIVTLLSPALRRAALRRRRLSRSGPVITLDRDDPEVRAGPVRPAVMVDAAAIDQARRDAHEAWAEVLDSMIDFTIPVDPSETPRATGERIGRLRGLSSTANAQVRLLAGAEERARYARLPLGAEGLDGAVAGVRTALAERATRRQRLSAMLLPRSVVLRWQAAWSRSVATTVARVGRVRDRVVGVLSPRRLVPGRR